MARKQLAMERERLAHLIYGSSFNLGNKRITDAGESLRLRDDQRWIDSDLMLRVFNLAETSLVAKATRIPFKL